MVQEVSWEGTVGVGVVPNHYVQGVGGAGWITSTLGDWLCTLGGGTPREDEEVS